MMIVNTDAETSVVQGFGRIGGLEDGGATPLERPGATGALDGDWPRAAAARPQTRSGRGLATAATSALRRCATLKPVAARGARAASQTSRCDPTTDRGVVGAEEQSSTRAAAPRSWSASASGSLVAGAAFTRAAERLRAQAPASVS